MSGRDEGRLKADVHTAALPAVALRTPGRGPDDLRGPRFAAPALSEVLRDPGRQLDGELREQMERRFGYNFGHVRVHTDARASTSARRLGAEAYTVGRHIVIAPSACSPESEKAERLLAHELAHVVQQQGAVVRSFEISRPEDRFERAAEEASRSKPGAAAIDQLHSPAGAVPLIQRQPARSTSFELDLGKTSLSASLAGSLTLDGFALNGSELTDEHRKEIKDHARRMLRLLDRYPTSFVSVVGHTDATGDEEDNKSLGQRRADAVKAALVAAGVQDDVMRPYSLGNTALRVKTRKAEPRNRRVEINFTARGLFKPGAFLSMIKPAEKLPPLAEINKTVEEIMKPHRPTKVGDLQRIIDDPKRSQFDRELARALKEVGQPSSTEPDALKGLAEKIKRHMEANVGDYTIKPDLETIFKGLGDLLGIGGKR